MKTVELSVGGKTFVAGEYLALHGGPALMLSTDPRFVLQVSQRDGESQNAQNIFHPQSPAGKFWNLHQEFFSGYQLKFTDPYQVGGFGASSAQFALLHTLWQLRNSVFQEGERFFDWHRMLSDYRTLGTDQGLPPSGADVVGACSGGLTWFDRKNGKVQTFSWPFLEAEVFVAHTGVKLATHEHLQTLGDFDIQPFEEAMAQVQQGLSHVNFQEFLAGLRAYRSVLLSQNRVTENTQVKVFNLESHPGVLFCKGCGAMGSDVIIVFCEKSKATEVRSLIQAEGLKLIADSSKISPGLQIRSLELGVQEVSL